MNNYYPATEIELDLRNVMWRLLSQWKAVLIVCIVMALLVPSAKYMKDKKAYDAYTAEQAVVLEEESLPLEEGIEKELASLEDEDVSNIRFILQQEELIALQNNYLKQSIWVNTNPTSQRTLSFKYYLQRGEVEEMKMLIDTYNTCMRRNKVMKDLRETLGYDCPLEFIYELVNTFGGEVADGNIDSVVYTVNVVLDDAADKEAVTKTVDRNISSINKEVRESLGPHSIKRFNIEDMHQYNSSVVDKRTNINYAINNLTNNKNAAIGRLSEEGKEALERIEEMNSAAANTESDRSEAKASEEETDTKTSDGNEIVQPVFSKKYAALGFVLGGILYAFAYLMRIILRRRIETSSSVTSYTCARLFGEIYKETEHKGLNKLFHSRFVDNLRYRGAIDEETQIGKIVTSLSATGEHAGTKDVTMFNLIKEQDNWCDDLKSVTSGLKKKGIKLSTQNVTDDIDEKSMLDLKDAVIAVSKETEIEMLSKVCALLREYDVRLLGSMYVEEV